MYQWGADLLTVFEILEALTTALKHDTIVFICVGLTSMGPTTSQNACREKRWKKYYVISKAIKVIDFN